MEYEGRYEVFDSSRILTYPVRGRNNKVKYGDLRQIDEVMNSLIDLPAEVKKEIDALALEIIQRRAKGQPILLFTGGHSIAGEAGDGEEAIAKYQELKPDLVTMDIVMPKMNGIEALKGIKVIDPAAKIIMCTAVGQEQMVKLAIKSGAKGYIVKPFQAPKVLEEVKNVLAS